MRSRPRRASPKPVTDAWDARAWDRLQAELARWPPGSATLWWRDDDAGAASPAFDRLLTMAAAHAVPLALAVVPAWLEAAVAAQIREAPPGVHVLRSEERRVGKAGKERRTPDTKK